MSARGRPCGEALLQVADGGDLGGPEFVVAPLGHQLGHGADAGEEGSGGGVEGVWDFYQRSTPTPTLPLPGGGSRLQPFGQCGGLVEGEDGAGTRLRVEAVAEVGLGTRALVDEGQRPAPRGQADGQALRIAGGLDLHAGERSALLLGLDHASGLAVHVEQVVGKAVAGVEHELADGHARRSVDISLVDIAYQPAGRLQQAVDGLPGCLFWLGHGPVLCSDSPESCHRCATVRRGSAAGPARTAREGGSIDHGRGPSRGRPESRTGLVFARQIPCCAS